MKRTIGLFSFLFLAALLYGRNTFTVSGRIYNITREPIFISLVDRETAETPFKAPRKYVIIPDRKDLNRGYVKFVFTGIPRGVYGIRCFQDMNGNGKLDEGLLGPKEPWGLSWNEHKTRLWPKFLNFNFTLTADRVNFIIKLYR